MTIDWNELKPGDLVKVVSGHGPYMMVDGKKHSVGVPGGKYKVRKLDKNGIHAYDGIFHVYIYMGKRKKSIVGGISCPHKIKKVITE